ncbi:hypothetical protein HID58_074921 [Brassica napus]|uniref:Uncharacterized protein n=1 Tax=Brassica napus TaxID=3708 RepID=A0ABQ7YJF3_BRANA|nr:hypothetical protein HID58_074921 [Brassica napus]
METASTLARDGDGENSPLDGDVREISRPISDLEMLTLGENCFKEQEAAKKIVSVPINGESSEGREIVTTSEGTEAMAQLGHKGQDCLSKDVRILRKQSVHGGGSEFATVSQDEDIVGRKEGNVIEDLLHNLEAVTPQAAQKALLVSNVALSGSETVMPSLEKDLLPKMKEDMQTIELIEPKTEGFLAVGCWEAGHGKMQGGNCVEDEVLVVSPSRFSPLQDIEEDEEEIVEEFAKEMEEGETLEGKTEGKSSQNPQVASRGMKTTNGSTQKQARSRVIHTRDLLHVGKQGTTKKSSVRKI